MSVTNLYILYHIARADFLERVRRYSFLIMLGAVLFLGYQAAIGNVTLQLGDYRGEFNSAWVGSMMALIASFFLGWFGFYLVKGSVARDRGTGVGQIMATTPLTRPLYTLGKWLSNFAVLIATVVILALVGVAIQIFAGESGQFDFITFFAPFLFVALPMLALTAALAVLFECVGFTQGGFGNMLYFFLFGLIISLAVTSGKEDPLLDLPGFHVLSESMGAAAKAVYPDYDGSFVLGSTGTPILGTFPWPGVTWTSNVVFTRLIVLGLGFILALASSVLFDRFDPSRRRIGRTKKAASSPELEIAPAKQATLQPVRLTPLPASTSGFAFIRVLASELKLLLKGQRWWWYAVAGGLILAALVSKPEDVRAFVLPITWLWPILIWSNLGNRENRNNTQQLVFSSAAPLVRQLPASWLAGFSLALLTGSGAALKLLSAGNGVGLLAWISAALFIPSLALASGVWSHSNKLFEVAYVSMWYLALNGLEAVDFFGATSSGNVGFYIPLSLALILAAFIGRARQVQN
jgi:ABC-type transport system involved in multi-copper enzyme maturation permease subunit